MAEDKAKAGIRETLQIRKIDKTLSDNPEPYEITISDKLYSDESRSRLLESTTFSVPGWVGEWSLYNQNLKVQDGAIVYPKGRTRTRVAIVGSQREYIPESIMNSYEWEVWACNSLWKTVRDRAGRFRADRWFELHPTEVQTPTELQRMVECPVPLYILHQQDVAMIGSHALAYPFEKVARMCPRNYYTCTFAYQIALAIAEGFTDIGVFGLELMFGTPRERTFERACVEFWLGVAMGKSITIHYPKHSRLCTHPFRYGYDYSQEKDFCDQKIFHMAALTLQEQGNANTLPQTREEYSKLVRDLDAAEHEEYFGEGHSEQN